jgi:hypothetical protein
MSQLTRQLMRQSMRDRKPFSFALFPCALLALGTLQASPAQEGMIAGNTTQEQRRTNEKPDARNPITLPSGTTISVRIADEVNSSHNHAGDLITGMVDPSVFIADHVIIPRGTEAHMRVSQDRKGGKLHGKAAVKLELVGLVINKEKLDVDSDNYGKKQGALSAKVKGAGTAGAAGASGAATSATPEGGAAGPIIAVFRAAKVHLPAGTRIPFTLTTPFTFDVPMEQSSQDGPSEPPAQQ